jgi:lysophospholipid acyltransferase (LPLAT)-like uncharacterized protein
VEVLAGVDVVPVSSNSLHATEGFAAHTIHAFWIADHVNLLALAFASSDFLRIASKAAFFADDSFGGMIMQSCLKRLGLQTLTISDRDAADRLRQLRRIVEAKPSSTYLAIDGRGPYFQVRTGVVNLSLVMQANIVPAAIVSRSALKLPAKLGSIGLPLPRARVIVALGPAIHPQRGASSVKAAAHLQAELSTIRSRTLAVLDHDRSIPTTAEA